MKDIIHYNIYQQKALFKDKYWYQVWKQNFF